MRGEVLAAERESSRKELGLDDRPVVLSFGGSLGACPEQGGGLYAGPKREKQANTSTSTAMAPTMRSSWMRSGDGPDVSSSPRSACWSTSTTCPSACPRRIWSSAGRGHDLTEIEAKAKASILIPSPNVAENHQFHNAMALVNRGAAEIIEEKDLTGPALWEGAASSPTRAPALSGGERGKMEILDANDRIYRAIKVRRRPVNARTQIQQAT